MPTHSPFHAAVDAAVSTIRRDPLNVAAARAALTVARAAAPRSASLAVI